MELFGKCGVENNKDEDVNGYARWIDEEGFGFFNFPFLTSGASFFGT